VKHVHFADAISPGKMIQVNQPDLEAVNKRFIEIYVRQPPNLPELPTEGSFTRLDMILGLMPRVMTILFFYNATHFKSRYYFLYALAGISRNICNLPEEKHEAVINSLVQLMNRYKLDESEKQQIISYLAV
jgi:hypothetical protein